MQSILIVDDEISIRESLTRILQDEGFQPISVESGERAIERVHEEKPDLILLDMSQPIMDGWTAAGELKHSDATKTIPIIALTAHAMSCDREKALDAGCDDYDTKPVEFKRLLGKIEALLSS